MSQNSFACLLACYKPKIEPQRENTLCEVYLTDILLDGLCLIFPPRLLNSSWRVQCQQVLLLSSWGSLGLSAVGAVPSADLSTDSILAACHHAAAADSSYYDTHTGPYKIINTENKQQFSVAMGYIISILCNGHILESFSHDLPVIQHTVFYFNNPIKKHQYTHTPHDYSAVFTKPLRKMRSISATKSSVTIRSPKMG